MSSHEFQGARGNSGELRGTQAALYFTVHNTLTETMPFTLTVDAAALGIAGPERLTVAELVSGDAVLYEVQGDLLLIWGELAPLDTLVFRLEEEATLYRLFLPLIYK